MIEGLVIEDFKSFATRQEIPLRPLTLIYGPNSAGKSSIFHALLLLAQTVGFQPETGFLLPSDQAQLVVNGPLIELKSYGNLIHRHEADRTLRLGLCFSQYAGHRKLFGFGGPIGEDSPHVAVDFAFQWVPERNLTRASGIRLDFTDDRSTSSLRLSRAEYGLPEVPTSLEMFAFDDDGEAGWQSWLLAQDDELAEAASTEPYFSAIGLLPGAPMWMYLDAGELRQEAEPEGAKEASDRWSSAISQVRQSLTEILKDVRHIGPLRQPIREHQIMGSGVPHFVGSTGEHLLPMLAHDRVRKKSIDGWLERLDIPYRLDLREYEGATGDKLIGMSLLDRRNSVFVNPGAVGFGISQILPVVMQCLTGEGAIVCIEQPELHLHPKLQAELADLFIEVTGESKGRRGATRQPHQLLIETHSESLMLRIQRRIREGRLDANRVAVLYVQTLSDGTSEVRELRLARAGMFIDEWPEGFFEERLREMLAGYEN